MAITHILSATTPDDPAYEIRPSHWNEAHAQLLTISGNTAGQSTFSGTNLVFSGGPNATLSLNGNTLVFSGGAGAAGNTGYVSAGTTNASLGTLSIANSNGLSFGIDGQTLTGSVASSLTNIRVSAGTTSNLLSAVTFGNANGVSFGLDASTVTASHNALTSQSNQNVTAGNGGFAFQTLSFSNVNGFSFGTSAGSAITGSYTVPTVPAQLSVGNSNLGNTAGDTGVFTGRVVLVGSNNITLSGSSNGGSQTISIIGGGGGGFSAGVSGGNTSGDTGATGTRVVFAGGNNVTLSQATDANGATITVSGANAGGAQTGISGAGVSDTTYSSGTVIFSAQANVTLGSSVNGASQYVRVSVGSQSNQTVGVYHVGNTTGQSSSSTADARTISIDGAGIVSAGWSNGSIRISATQSNQAFSADASSTFQTLTFQNSNGVSFSNNAGALRVTHDLAFSSQTNNTGRIYVTAQSTGQSSSSSYDLRTLSIVPDGIVSAGWSNGSFRISATQSNQAFSADASSTFQTLSFQNSNGFTFSNNAGAIRASYSVPVVSNAIASVGSATNSGTNTSRFAADDHVHAGVFSMGVSTGGNTAGDTRVDVGRFVLAGGNNITLSMATAANALNTITISAGAGGGGFTGGMSNIGNTAGTSGTVQSQMLVVGGPNITVSQSINGNSATLSISGNAPGAAAENNNINLLGANTAGNTTASGSTIGLSGINITLSGTNNSVVNISAPATSSLIGISGISVSTNGSTISIRPTTESGWNPYADFEKQAGQYGQATLQFDPMRAGGPAQWDRIVIPLINTNSSNSSGSHTLSFWVGLYTRNAATLSLLASTSSSTALTHSGTAGSYSLYSGNRLFTIPHTTTVSGGDYWLGFVSRTTSGGTNGSYSHMVMSNIASNFLGHFGSSHNTTYQLTLGQGVYTATTSGMPGSVGFSQIRGSDSQARRAAFIMFASGTV